MNPKSDKNLVTAILLFIMFLVPSCTGPLASSNPHQISLPTHTATYEPISADCLWKATGKAWMDDNQNGLRDPGEKPLSNIKFWVDDPLNDYQKVNELLSDTVASDEEGNVEISVWLPGCPDVEFEVYTESPQGCEITTEERISVDMNIDHPVYSFGFICH